MRNIINNFIYLSIKMLIIPGETIDLEIKERKLNKHEVAKQLLLTDEQLESLIQWNLEITPSLACHLENVFHIHSEFWLNFEKEYQIQKAKNQKYDTQKAINSPKKITNTISFKILEPAIS